MSADPSDHCVHAVDHVKKLPDADRAAEILQEIKRHADPLLRARGWRVKRLYEICCCTSGGRNLGVGGFCCPAGDGVTSLRIAIRLRQPRSHELHTFEHCMKVMIHEMSHIVHGNHSSDFYRLMEKQQSSKLELLKVAAEANRNSGDVHSGYPSVYAKSVA